MPSPLKEQWSEFDWEKELRKDDARVNAYFQELPKYIDLPREDEIIYRRLQRQRHLAPQGGEWPFHDPAEKDPPPDDARMDEEERKKWDEKWLKREGADSYILCGKLARALCTFFAEKSQSPEISGKVMAALAMVGKMMARCTDLIELEPGELPAFRIAVCKRLADDANTLLGYLDEFRTEDVEGEGIVDYVFAGTQEFREQVLDILTNARKPGKHPRFGNDPDTDDIPF